MPGFESPSFGPLVETDFSSLGFDPAVDLFGQAFDRDNCPFLNHDNAANNGQLPDIDRDQREINIAFLRGDEEAGTKKLVRYLANQLDANPQMNAERLVQHELDRLNPWLQMSGNYFHTGYDQAGNLTIANINNGRSIILRRPPQK